MLFAVWLQLDIRGLAGLDVLIIEGNRTLIDRSNQHQKPLIHFLFLLKIKDDIA